MTPPSDHAQLWDATQPGIELFQAHLFHHHFGKHAHDAYTIGFNEAGLGHFFYRGETHTAQPGCFNLINPGELHTGQVVAPDLGWRFRDLYISVQRVEQLLAQLEWPGQSIPAFGSAIAWDQRLRSGFPPLFQALSTPTPRLVQDSLLLDVLSSLFLRHATPRFEGRSPQTETRAIALARAYLETHYTDAISVDHLAQVAGLSPYYLIRCFRQQVGLPPHRYQQHWQLLQAKRSLRTPQPLADIAVAHGFYDQSHLNRCFKQAFGVTPGQYRKSNSIQSSPAG